MSVKIANQEFSKKKNCSKLPKAVKIRVLKHSK